MSDPQRTHKATPKRARQFRKRGEIALSRDMVSTATLAGDAIALITCAGTGAALAAFDYIMARRKIAAQTPAGASSASARSRPPMATAPSGSSMKP